MTTRKRRQRVVLLILTLSVLLVAAGAASLVVGVVEQTPAQTVSALVDGARAVFLHQPYPDDALHTIVLNLRLPRLALAALVGLCLALSGAIMQALFQNSLADPYLLGVSSGAALGAVIAMMLGAAVAAAVSLPLFTFIGATVVVFVVYGLAQRGGRVQTGALLLTGIAVGSLVSAITSFIMLLLDQDLRQVLFWLLGGLSGRGWAEVRIIAPVAAVGIVATLIAIRPLNLLLLGDETAASLGLNLQLSKRLLLALSSLLAAAAVAVSGIIAFVGLVVPHVSRLLVGPDHRHLLPVAGLLGALLMIVSDMAARTVLGHAGLGPTELPIGIITSALGCPFFLVLLRAHGRKGL